MAEYFNYCLDRLRELIAGCDRLLPHLETITLRLRYSSDSQWDKSKQGELKSLCAGADKVDFVE